MLKTNLVLSKDKKTLLLTLGLLLVLFPLPYKTSVSSEKPMNIMIILTDDQRHDTMWAMPKTTELLGKRGVTFTEAVVSTPLCCPSRAGLLSGGYFARNTGVLTNLLPNGGAVNFSKVDKKALQGRLRKSGYNTGLFGKYLNEYALIEENTSVGPWPYIPPGWTSFVVSAEHNSPTDWSSYPVVKGSSEPYKANKGESLSVENQYVTDYFGGELLSFIDKSKTEGKPFFAIFSTHGPHGPSKYPTEDEGKFSEYVYSAPSMDEDLSDKPAYVIKEASGFGPDTENQKVIKNMLRSLQPIDRSVEKIVQKLTDLEELENTVIIFTSDNGTLWGEHKLKGKSAPYEEAIRVPFIISYPGGKMDVENNSYIYANLDLAATVQEIADIYPMTDGESLLPLLTQDMPKWRKEIYTEWFKVGSSGLKSSWSSIKLQTENGKKFKYTEYQSGEKELYVLSEDPYEENNVANDPQYTPRIARLSEKLAPKKGLSIKTNIPNALLTTKVGEQFSFQFEAWGSKKPYTWSIVQNLPAGLSLDPVNGILSGTPTEVTVEPVHLDVKATGSSKALYADRPQEFILTFQIMIIPQTSTNIANINWFSNQDTEKLKLQAEDEVWRMN